MLSREEVARVEGLLGRGKTWRKVAQLTGLARGTVGAIARGEHPQQHVGDEARARVAPLLARGRSAVDIANATGLPAGAVYVISREIDREKIDADQTDAGGNAPEGNEPRAYPFRGPGDRCPECGRMVQLPCLACHAGESPARPAVEKKPPSNDAGETAAYGPLGPCLGLDLPKDRGTRRRYLACRRRARARFRQGRLFAPDLHLNAAEVDGRGGPIDGRQLPTDAAGEARGDPAGERSDAHE